MSTQPVPSSPSIFDAWDTYHKVVAANFMFHREIAAALQAALLARFAGRPSAFLDLGCGDAFALAPVLRAVPPSRYKGVDLSRTALALAERELADLPCPVVLAHGDIIEALGEDAYYDVIHSSFALHHLPTEQKAEFFRRAARRLAPGGLLPLIDTFRDEGESLAAYLDRYRAWLRREWKGMSAAELDAVCDHIAGNDMPEPYSTLVALAAGAGLEVAPGGAQHGAHRLVCFARG